MACDEMRFGVPSSEGGAAEPAGSAGASEVRVLLMDAAASAVSQVTCALLPW